MEIQPRRRKGLIDLEALTPKGLDQQPLPVQPMQPMEMMPMPQLQQQSPDGISQLASVGTTQLLNLLKKRKQLASSDDAWEADDS